MITPIAPLIERRAWKALEAHHKNVRDLHLRKLFADDSKRGERMTAEAVGLLLDYSKNRITDETLKLLLQLAEESGLRARIDAMFRGEKINITENRAVLHVALRAPRGASILVDGENVVPAVHGVIDRMADFSDRIRSGAWKGHTGKRIRNAINIGIGGSDLGPVMAYEALKHYSERAMTFRFVSNVDGTDLAEAVRILNRENAVSSSPRRRLRLQRRSPTPQLQRNGCTAAPKEWDRTSALCGNVDEYRRSAVTFGIQSRLYVRILGLGRRALFALESAIGLSISGRRCRILPEELLAGSWIDEYFSSARLNEISRRSWL